MGSGTQPLSPGGAVLDNGRLVLAYNLGAFRSDTYVIWTDQEGDAGTWRPVQGGSIAPVTVFNAASAGVPQLPVVTGVFPSLARSPLARVGGANLLYLAYHRYSIEFGEEQRVRIFLARSSDGGATWPTHLRLPLQTGAPQVALANQDFAAIAVDGLGGINVLWRETVGPPGIIHHTIYYARFHHLGSPNPHYATDLFSWTSDDYAGGIGDYHWIAVVDQRVYVAYCGAIGETGQIHVVVRRIDLELE